jgi:hypothetical protein
VFRKLIQGLRLTETLVHLHTLTFLVRSRFRIREKRSGIDASKAVSSPLCSPSRSYSTQVRLPPYGFYRHKTGHDVVQCLAAESRCHPAKRNLYKSLSRIMLDLAIPLDKIGSFTVDDDGQVSLSHRPLTLRLAALENEGIPTQISPKTCYSRTDSYLHDLLHCHDLKLQHQPNSVRSRLDAEGQMAVLTGEV